MDEPPLPPAPARMSARLRELRDARRRRQAEARTKRKVRQNLSPLERAAILKKTDGRCHICGGLVVSGWQADHVLCHSGGGKHSVDNYLPAHALCNNYRWDYDPEEFQWVLKIGVWARRQMEAENRLGNEMANAFYAHEKARSARRRGQVEDGASTD